MSSTNNSSIAGPSSDTAAAQAQAQAQATHVQSEKEYKKRLQELRQQADHQYKATAKSAETAAVATAVATTSASQELLQNEKRIEHDVCDVVRQAALVQKRINDWAVQYGKFNDALKELGDVANWSHTVQADIQDTVTILSAVVKTKRRAVGMDDSSAAQ